MTIDLGERKCFREVRDRLASMQCSSEQLVNNLNTAIWLRDNASDYRVRINATKLIVETERDIAAMRIKMEEIEHPAKQQAELVHLFPTRIEIVTQPVPPVPDTPPGISIEGGHV
jgi:hypothetical protein